MLGGGAHLQAAPFLGAASISPHLQELPSARGWQAPSQEWTLLYSLALIKQSQEQPPGALLPYLEED